MPLKVFECPNSKVVKSKKVEIDVSGIESLICRYSLLH